MSFLRVVVTVAHSMVLPNKNRPGYFRKKFEDVINISKFNL